MRKDNEHRNSQRKRKLVRILVSNAHKTTFPDLRKIYTSLKMVKKAFKELDTEARKCIKFMWEANRCKKKSIVGRYKYNLTDFQDLLETTEDL